MSLIEPLIPTVIGMTNTILVPVNSPAFDSYLHEGWREVYVDGLWATLRRDQDRRRPSGRSQFDREVLVEKRKTESTDDVA